MGATVRVSQLYGLTGNQGTFDFIDVDVERDTPLFIDPAVLATINSPWASECTSGIQTYFQAVLDRILAGDEAGAMNLLSYLGEDNSTHLGFSSTSHGSGLGVGLAAKFYEELSTSTAVKSGLITDIEDTALLVEGVREDRISDVVTNVIRRQLVEYTQAVSDFYGIPLEPNLAVGPYWNGAKSKWEQRTADLPLTVSGPLLLVPKAIVRRVLFHDPSQYYRHYVLEYFRAQELDQRSPLVYSLKSGALRVRKGDVEDKYREKHDARPDNPGVEKRVNVDGTLQNPDLLRRFKEDKAADPPAAPEHEVIAEATGSQEPDLDALLAAVTSIVAGKSGAYAYERAVEALLAALMYPRLVNPIRQEKIHSGRKIIDISFTNMATEGFFHWLSLHYPAANIFVECKNYVRPLVNPEFDQIAGRFSPSRGRFGVLVYRSFDDKQKILESLRDTAADDRGWVIALDDKDLAELVDEAKVVGHCTDLGGLLHDRFKALIN
jgi:hypothetical protein